MDQKKIGKFIQEMRKQKKLTQQELAEKLGVSDKTISRWENGINLPDASLYNSLCTELNISINELLSGQKLKDKEYQQKLEENIILLNDNTKKSVKKFKKYTIFTMILLFLLISLSGLLLYVKNRYDYQLTTLKNSEVKYKVCKYNSPYGKSQILVKVYAKDNGGSMLRVLHDYEEDKIIVVNNTRYKKWLYNKNVLKDVKTDILSIDTDYKKIYYLDTLIWNDTMPLEECIESKGFTRTYQILNIKKSDDKEYMYLTISEFQNEKPYVVKVRMELASNIIVGKNYEFSFRHNKPLGYVLKDEISEIFDNLELISVKETNKINSEQVHDEIL